VPHLRRYPGFPADLGGAGELHAAFLIESRTRSLGWSHVQEIRVGTIIHKVSQPYRAGLADVPPDFLLRFMALMHFMRLSLRKGAHAALSSAAWQEIRVG
jgi:hypothetical protein